MASILLLGLCSLAAQVLAYDAHHVRLLGAQGVNLLKLEEYHQAKARSSVNHGGPLVVQGIQDDIRQQADPDIELWERDANDLVPRFNGYWFRQPLDHFSNSTRKMWRQRYWVSTRHYKPGTNAPVIVLDGGETSGVDRLPFLDTGIVDILAKATGGVGVVLEHRYYGTSLPVCNYTTDGLRFLTNEQAAADSANFMANVKFRDIDEDLTAPNTPWIYYGGSYAGARAAHMRILYPDLVWGAIASSAVTHASIENWEYTDIIRLAADPKCSAHLVDSIETIDQLLSQDSTRKPLKALFGLQDLQHDEDFASLIESPLGAWQAKNWDPEVGSTRFDEFCEALDYPFPPAGVDGLNETIFYDHDTKMVSFSDGLQVDLAVYNYGTYVKKTIVSWCPRELGIEECFGTFDNYKWQETTLAEKWRLWIFQVCTQWGYFGTAPPEGVPRIVSRLKTLKYESMICRQAFPEGDFFKVPPLPNITAVNALGDFDIAADRLAFIDGDVDPWKPNTPHSRYASDREDTILRPFKLIPNGVHHYDEFGLRNMTQEPPEILKIHTEMIEFVTAWLDDWKAKKNVTTS